jgi:ribonuclease HII
MEFQLVSRRCAEQKMGRADSKTLSKEKYQSRLYFSIRKVNCYGAVELQLFII